MLQKIMLAGLTLAFAASTALAADTPSTHASLSAAEIVAKNIQARGGLQAWRSVQSLSWSGKMGAGGNQRSTLPVALPGKQAKSVALPSRPKDEAQLPFLMEMQRPRKTRIELQFNGDTALQVYDGANGWKLRPFLNRREVETYTADELKAAAKQTDIDGPLVDYAAKGTQIGLEGLEKVEDRNTYKLKLTHKNGEITHIWIDAATFLETKIEGQPRRLDGKEHPVEIYYRDYRDVNGLQIPFVLETKVLPVSDSSSRVKELPIPAEKIVLEKVLVNPKLDASHFTKPDVQVASARH